MRRGEFKLIGEASSIVDMYRQGVSATAIGRRFGVSDRAVIRLLKHLGVTLRSLSEAMRITSEDPQWKENLAGQLRGKPSGVSGKRWTYGRRLERPWISGEKNPGWKGGITPLVAALRTDARYAEWRLSIFRRDGFRCVQCGVKPRRRSGLNTDHIRPLSHLIRLLEIKTIDDACQRQELWDIENGRTLCIDCHKQTDTFGLKALGYREG